MSHGNEIRQHYYLQKAVIIAPKRNKRPTSFKTVTETSSSSQCVLCNNTEKSVYSVEDADSWRIKSVQNPYSVLSEHQRSAYGFQEVIIESPKHVTKYSEHSLPHIKTLLDTYADRSDSLKKRQHVRYVSIFKNNGPSAGATLQHQHSQVFAFPFVPAKVQTEVTALLDYKKINKRCAICDIIVTESQDRVRVLFESENVIAICPFASEYQYEVQIIPKKHAVSLSKTTNATRYDIAAALNACISYLEELQYDYNYYVNDMHHSGTHTYLRITPRASAPKIPGGLEVATDIAVNSISPEQAAAEYQQHARLLLPALRYATAK